MIVQICYLTKKCLQVTTFSDEDFLQRLGVIKGVFFNGLPRKSLQNENHLFKGKLIMVCPEKQWQSCTEVLPHTEFDIMPS